MEAQEIFDTVARHLLTQEVRAEHPVTNGCVYRTPNGLACAVGCLLTDDEAKEADDVGQAGVFDLKHMQLLPERLVEHALLLSDLQRVHDIEEPSVWRSALELVARKHRLNAIALEETR